MTHRTTRVIRLLQLLRRSSALSLKALSERLECSTRTVYRDLQLLRNEGIPVDHDRVADGYRVGPELRHGVPAVTRREEAALLLSALTSPLSRVGPIAELLDEALRRLIGCPLPHRPKHLMHIGHAIRIGGDLRQPLPTLTDRQLTLFGQLLTAALEESRADILWRPVLAPRHARRERGALVESLRLEDGGWKVILQSRFGVRVDLDLTEVQEVVLRDAEQPLAEQAEAPSAPSPPVESPDVAAMV